MQRKHIFKLATIAIVALSLLTQLVMPLTNQVKKKAFTNWLTNNVISSGSDSEIELRNSIRELPEQSPDFWMLVQQASELVAANRDDFKIRFSVLPESHSVTSYLIDQWNMYQSHNTAQNAVIPDIIQPINKWFQSNTIHPTVFSTARTRILSPSYKSFSYISNHFSIPARIPLLGGISINAP